MLVVMTMLVSASAASACSCAPQPPGESLREADGAVVGRLVKVLPHGPLHAVFRYEVRHVYKGADLIDAGEMLDVRSARRGAACGLPRRTGRSYGLFLSHRHGRWFGGICGVIAPQRLRVAAQSQVADSARAPVQPVLCG
ncbi:MAG: Tissue inhibitor of metalloproteinase [Solirubrobacterales bacterium]|nr:Tissue inhibitor of metalloproteinase [Solirubrobacterales bacterium]